MSTPPAAQSVRCSLRSFTCFSAAPLIGRGNPGRREWSIGGVHAIPSTIAYSRLVETRIPEKQCRKMEHSLASSVENPKPGAVYYVVLASLLMFLLQVFPWSEGFMTGFFNGWDTVVYEHQGRWVVTGEVPYRDILQVYPPLDVIMTAPAAHRSLKVEML